MPRAWKIPLWIIGSLLLLVVLVLISALVIGNTESGRALIVRMTSRMTDGRVEISGIHGSFPAALDLDKLELRDEHGVWLIAEHTSLRWSPLALIARHVEVESLRIGRLRIERAPVSQPETKPASGPISIPRSDLAHLDIDTLELGQELAGAETSATLHASAHWRSMQDAIATLNAQRTSGRGNYEASLRLSADRIDATLKLQEPADGPLENLLQLPGLGDLSVLARLSGPRTAENLELTLNAGSLKGRVKGIVDLKGQSGDLDYAITADQMELRPGLAWQSVDIQGRWQGTLSSPEANGHLVIKQLQIPGGTQLANLAANLTATAGMLRAHATLEELVIPGSQPKMLQDAPLTLDASAHLSDPQRPVDITVAHRLLTLQAHAVTTGKQSAQLDLRLPDIAPFAALADEKVKGEATLKASVMHDGRSTKLTGDVDAKLDGGAASWAGLVRDGNTRLQLAGSMTDSRITLDKLELTGHALFVGASGNITRTGAQNLDIRLNLDLPDLKQISPTVAGALKLSGRVNGPTTALSTVADLTSTLSIHGSPPGTVSAAVRAAGLPKAPRGTIEAHGDLDGSPLVLNATLERGAGDVMHAIVRHADWKSAHIEGDLTSGKEIAQARGSMRFGMGQLADLNRLLGTTLQGSVAGNIRLTPAPRRSHAQISIEAHDVVTGGITANAKFAATGAMDALAIQLDAQSPAIGGNPASINSTATLNAVASEVRLTSLEAQYRGQTLKLLGPAKVSFASGLSIHTLKLGAHDAVLELDGRISPTLDARASLQQIKPDLINAFVPNLLSAGTIQASAHLQGTLSAPRGKLHFEAIGLRSSNDMAVGLPAIDLRSDDELTESSASIDAKLNAGKASHLALSGHAPISADGHLDLKLGGTLDVGLLNPIAEASGKHVTGALTIDTKVTGAIAAPEIDGTVRLANGSMRDYTQGINLTDITGTITGGHGMLQIQELNAKAAPGTVSVSGTIGVSKDLPVDIKLTAKDAQPIASNIITANVNADIQISGAAREKLDVTGKVNVNRANVQIPSSFPPDVAVLDVRRPGAAPPPTPEKPLVIALNITVDAPRQILVKGRGLDAEMGGEIRVHGTSAAPVVGGSFDLQRGTFTLGSSRLNFTQGTVTFNGQGLRQKIDPSLNFIAETQVADVTATVKITGLADAPKLELSSTPELPQDEIMARLLFGQSASQLSAFQVVQIGAALAQLTGGGGGLNPLAKVQKTLGLDRLTIGTSTAPTGASSGPAAQQSTGYSVEAGRYVTSRVFVAVKEQTGGFTQVAVDVDLTRGLKLQTRFGNGTASTQGTTPENDPGSSIGLAYQFEY
jgi:translocation and assembly module TamB